MLAYASYIGALEAISRGYRSVAAPLLQNTSLCVQAVERFHSNSENNGSARHKIDGSTDDNSSGFSPSDTSANTANAERAHPSQPRCFPPCMSRGALVFDTIRYLISNNSSQRLKAPSRHGSSCHPARSEGGGAARLAGRAYEQQVSLKIARRIREEERDVLSSGDADVIDALLTSAGRSATATEGVAALVPGLTSIDSSSSSRTGSPSTSTVSSECKTRDAENNRYGLGGGIGLLEIPTTCSEIISSGSRLPSCRRHGCITWESARISGFTEITRPPRSGQDFGQQAWPLARGAIFFLEDGETQMSLSNAHMWAKVNPFSPLNTGCRIMPF